MNTARRPIVIEHVRPAVDDGRYPVKREVGNDLHVTADIFKEGHDVLAAVIRCRAGDDAEWGEAPLRCVDNDGGGGSFTLEAKAPGRG